MTVETKTACHNTPRPSHFLPCELLDEIPPFFFLFFEISSFVVLDQHWEPSGQRKCRLLQSVSVKCLSARSAPGDQPAHPSPS